MTRRRLLILGFAIVAAAFIAIFVFGGDDSGDKVATTASPQLQEATETELSSLAGEQDHDVYWVGAKSGDRYEWTRTNENRVYVRYLQGNAKVGTRKETFLTIATYPLKNALKALQKQAADSPGSQTETLADGAFVYYSATSTKNSAYVAFPDSDYEVEVYDPKPGNAYEIAKSGQVQPIP